MNEASNPKLENRNPKQTGKTRNGENSESAKTRLRFSAFRISDLFRISNFSFRIDPSPLLLNLTATLFTLLALTACRSTKQDAAKKAAAEPPRVRHEFKFIGYSPDTSVLSIQFNDGTRSNFTGVTQPTYMALINAPSKLAYFTNSIQSRFASQPEE